MKARDGRGRGRWRLGGILGSVAARDRRVVYVEPIKQKTHSPNPAKWYRDEERK